MPKHGGNTRLFQGWRDTFLFLKWEGLISVLGAYLLAALEFNLYRDWSAWTHVFFTEWAGYTWWFAAACLALPPVIRKGFTALRNRQQSAEQAVRRTQAVDRILRTVVAKRAQRIIPRVATAFAGTDDGKRYLSHFLSEIVAYFTDDHDTTALGPASFEAAFYRLEGQVNGTVLQLANTTNEARAHRRIFSNRNSEEEKCAVELIRTGTPIFCPDVRDQHYIDKYHLDITRTRSYAGFISVPVFADPSPESTAVGMLSINASSPTALQGEHAEVLQHLAWFQGISEAVSRLPTPGQANRDA